MQKKISVTFNSTWILSKKDDSTLPVQAFVEFIKDIYDIEVLDTSLTECELIIKGENLSESEISQKISELLKEKFSIEDLGDIVDYSISDYIPVSEEKEADVVSKEKDESKDTADIDKTEKIISRINTLVGAEEFKKLADECVRIAPGLIKHNCVEAFTHQCYLFAVNDGNGLSTYLELFAELLSELGLFKFSDKGKVAEIKLFPINMKDKGINPFTPVYGQFQRAGSTGGKIVSIDIREWMTNVSENKFREFLSILDDHLGENIYIFRVPFVEKEILTGLTKGLGDVLSIKAISFVPFNNDELTACALESLNNRGFEMEADAWDIFHARITEEKNDGRFYGINTVNKVIREMIYRKHLDNAFNGIDDSIIKKSEIKELSASYTNNEKTGWEMLDGLIGMESIKRRVEEIVAQIELSAKNENLGAPCIHMRFVGNPGTGKTTVARVIGKILKEKGILRNGNFFECTGRALCGRYVGETAPKTAAICRDAYGSVLFIDEAYSLYREKSGGDYGKEAIDTLIAEMENHRSDLVVIMAGYTDEMALLMTANAGLESRMPYVIDFPNYTREQLAEIFMNMVKKNFEYQVDFEDEVKNYFLSLPEEIISSKEFSNARFVRNLFERTWGKAVLRAQLNKEELSSLAKEDFLQASAEKEFKKIMSKQNKSLGFI